MPSALQCDDLVHADIERFGRNFFYKLIGEADARFVGRGNVRQEAVIISFSASQPITIAVECYAGNQNEVDALVAGERFSRRFFDAVCTRCKIFRPGVQPQLQIISCNYRKQYLLGVAPFPDKGMRIHFIFQRVVEQYGICRSESRMCFEGGKYFSRLMRSGSLVLRF